MVRIVVECMQPNNFPSVSWTDINNLRYTRSWGLRWLDLDGCGLQGEHYLQHEVISLDHVIYNHISYESVNRTCTPLINSARRCMVLQAAYLIL